LLFLGGCGTLRSGSVEMYKEGVGSFSLNLSAMRWEMDLRCGFDMIYGMGTALEDFLYGII
jgi:hypothetical protein